MALGFIVEELLARRSGARAIYSAAAGDLNLLRHDEIPGFFASCLRTDSRSSQRTHHASATAASCN